MFSDRFGFVAQWEKVRVCVDWTEAFPRFTGRPSNQRRREPFPI